MERLAPLHHAWPARPCGAGGAPSAGSGRGGHRAQEGLRPTVYRCRCPRFVGSMGRSSRRRA